MPEVEVEVWEMPMMNNLPLQIGDWVEGMGVHYTELSLTGMIFITVQVADDRAQLHAQMIQLSLQPEMSDQIRTGS